MPGSEQALSAYIDALGRGAPNYDDMTPQLAAITRQQLLLYQAVLARLGTLRAMSFRAVTQTDNDVYLAHFSNGSAEWRIGLVKEGKIEAHFCSARNSARHTDPSPRAAVKASPARVAVAPRVAAAYGICPRCGIAGGHWTDGDH